MPRTTAEASHSEVLPSVEKQIRSNRAQQAHDTRPAEDSDGEEVLQALTTRLESDAELVEYERNMAERTQQEVGANRAEVTSALEAVAANNAQLVARENVSFEQCDIALRQTVRKEFDGYRAHVAVEMQEAPTLRLELLRFAISSGSSSMRVPVEWNNMPASTVKCLQRHSTTPVLMLKIVANDLRKASSVNAIALQSLSLFLRIGEPEF